MSEDFINTLPTELLCQVFDLLEFEDQLQAMRMCANWSSILSDDRFAFRRCLCLTPYVTQGGNLDDLKSLQITAFRAEHSNDLSVVTAIQKFLYSEEISSSAEELRLTAFRLGKGKLHLPMLKKLMFKDMNVIDVIVPALNQAEVDHFSSAGDQVKCFPFGDKLTTLKLSIYDTSILSVMGLSFENLRNLDVYGYDAFVQSNINHWKLIVRHLTYLKIEAETWSHHVFEALWSILPEAKNLQVMYISVLYIELMRLVPQLCELSLEATHEEHSQFRLQKPYTKLGHSGPIQMPNLIKLTTTQSMIHVLVTPKIRLLTIQANEDSHQIEPTGLHRLSNEWSTDCSQLSAIRLAHVNLVTSDIRKLLELPKLETLEFLNIAINHSDVELILGALQSKLHRVRFEDCFWFRSRRSSSRCYDELARRYPEDVLRRYNEESLRIRQSYFHRGDYR